MPSYHGLNAANLPVAAICRDRRRPGAADQTDRRPELLPFIFLVLAAIIRGIGHLRHLPILSVMLVYALVVRRRGLPRFSTYLARRMRAGASDAEIRRALSPVSR